MLKLVGLFMLDITDKVIAQMSIVATEIQKDTKSMVFEETVADVLLYGTLIFISLFSALLMSQVPSIASGILSGGASGAGFTGLKAVRTSLAAKGLSSGGAMAYKGAKSGGAMAYKGAKYAAQSAPAVASSVASSVSSLASKFRGGGGGGATSGVSSVSPMSPTSSAAGNPYANMQTPAYMRAAAAQRAADFVGPIKPGP